MNRKNLRKKIRKLIVESEREQRAEITNAIEDYTEYISDTNPDKRSVHLDDLKMPRLLRRQAKILWNKYADHDFFDSGVFKFHKLSYGGQGNNIADYFKDMASKNELSCYGIEKSMSSLSSHDRLFKDSVRSIDGFEEMHIVFEISGRTTWAGNFDAFTEELGRVSDEQLKFHKSSGIPKRPGSMKNMGIDAEDIADLLVLDKSDMKRVNKLGFSRDRGNMEELVVDNWKMKTVYITLSSRYENLLPGSGDQNYSTKKQFIDLSKKGKTCIRELRQLVGNLERRGTGFVLQLGDSLVDYNKFMDGIKTLVKKGIVNESIDIEDFEDVEQTAYLAHFNQKRRDGTPYISHPLTVKAITAKYYPNNLSAQLLALLHDSLEDGPKQGHITEKELRQFIRGSIRDPSASEEIIKALEYMTHDKNVFPDYEDYLEDVFSNRLAAIVKVSDLIHNLSHNPSKRQIEKYRRALEIVPVPPHISRQHKSKLDQILYGSR